VTHTAQASAGAARPFACGCVRRAAAAVRTSFGAVRGGVVRTSFGAARAEAAVRTSFGASHAARAAGGSIVPRAAAAGWRVCGAARRAAPRDDDERARHGGAATRQGRSAVTTRGFPSAVKLRFSFFPFSFFG